MAEQDDIQANAIRQAQGQKWRPELKINDDRRNYLAWQRDNIEPDIDKGIFPFKDIKLNRADVEWLLATHENGKGPVDWNEESQRKRDGLDLRGANLQEEDLRSLPLARLRGGLTFDEGVWRTDEQRKMAAVNLQKAHLEKADLQEAELWGANLQDAHLEKADLRKAHLWGADLRKAHLWGANLQDAHLEKADLQEVVDLGKADLRKAKLAEAKLRKAYLTEANLKQAKLEKADLQDAYLVEANLQEAELWGANLQDAHLEKADLRKAKLVEANLRKAHLWGANLQDAYLEEANLQETNLSRAELNGANLTKVKLGNEKQVGPQTVDCQWGNANLAVIDWSNVKILGEDYVARQKKDSQEEIKKHETSLYEYETAVRANRQLTIVLRDQGLNEKADDFAYHAQVIQWQVLQRQMLQRLDQAQKDLQKQENESQNIHKSERLNIPQIFVDFLYGPSLILSNVNSAPEAFFPKRVFFLILQLILQLLLFFYLVLFAPIILCLVLLLCMPFIFIWLLKLTLSLAVHLSLMLLPKQRKRLQDLFTLLHLPGIEQCKHDVGSAIQQISSITQLYFKILSGHVTSMFSLLLDLLAGYGYKPELTVFWYLLTISVFAKAYYVIWNSNPPDGNTQQALNVVGAIIFSITAFHGRGFFLGNNIPYDSSIAILGAVEAVIGLFIELSFIATFTGRFFRR